MSAGPWGRGAISSARARGGGGTVGGHRPRPRSSEGRGRMSVPLHRPDAAEKAARVRLFLVDVDGVLTDGGIVYDGGGREIKRFHVRDGHGIKMLQRAGVEVGIIPGRTSEVVAVRAKELEISLVRQGVRDKVAAWREILAGKGVSPGETAYVGDDIVDVPLMRRVGFAASVADAGRYGRGG